MIRRMSDDTLEWLEDKRLEATVQASNQARNLAVAGVAAVWLFSSEYFLHGKGSKPAGSLLIAGGLFAFALGLDLIQLAIRALGLTNYLEKTAFTRNAEGNLVVEIPAWITKWTRWPFVGKIALCIAGYIFVGVHLLSLID